MNMKCILSNEEESCLEGIPDAHKTSALKIKNSIQQHKWIEGEKGRNLTWEQAKDEWFDLQPEYEKGWINLQFSLEKYMLYDE